MLYLKRLEGIIFYLSVFSISLQLGKHFWPPFAFINGVRVDYLSPTLYLSDIFILLLFIFTLILNPKLLLGFLSKSFILPLFLFSILISSLIAKSPDASFIWSLKILEIIFYGWYVSNVFFSKKKFGHVIDIIIIAALIQSVIAFFQFILQRSIGGNLYYLGERTFNVDTIGIATFFTSGRELLRAYGTFSHPNVLALFLSIAIILGVYYISSRKSGKRSYFYIAALFFITLGLFLTASRIIIFLTIIISLFAFIKSRKHFTYSVLVLLIIIPVYLLLFSGRYLTVEPLIDAAKIRIDLFAINLNLLFESLFFGLGLNNTFLSVSNSTLPIYVRFQPVHNIYLHILVQVGLLGAVPAGLFILKIMTRVERIIKNKSFPAFPVALLSIGILIIGLFDHFPVTLQQGLLMSTFVCGLLFNSSMEQE